MKRIESSIGLGIALIGLGILFLLQNLGLLGALAGLAWAVFFAAAGASFLIAFTSNSAQWWALIPGFTLLSLAALIFSQQLAPGVAEPWGGTLFLGGIGLGFCTVYLTGRERWWAIIPGGVLLTLALLAGVSAGMPGPDVGWLFFLGLGLTFALVALVPTPHGRMRWALLPAGVLLGLALLGMAFTAQTMGIFWPAVLIAAGLFLALRAVRSPQGAQPAKSEAATYPSPQNDLPAFERAVGDDEALELAHKKAL